MTFIGACTRHFRHGSTNGKRVMISKSVAEVLASNKAEMLCKHCQNSFPHNVARSEACEAASQSAEFIRPVHALLHAFFKFFLLHGDGYLKVSTKVELYLHRRPEINCAKSATERQDPLPSIPHATAIRTGFVQSKGSRFCCCRVDMKIYFC